MSQAAPSNSPPDKLQPVPLTSSEIRFGMRLDIFSGSLGSIWSAVFFGMPLTMLLEALNASGTLMGIAQSIRQLAMALQMPGALLAEFARRRKVPWAIMASLHRLLWFGPAVALLLRQSPDRIIMATLIAMGAGTALDSLTASSWHSWMADLIPERSRGQFWSTRQSFTVLVVVLATFASGLALDFFGRGGHDASLQAFGWVFVVAAFFGTLDVILHLWVPEPLPTPRRRGLSVASRIMQPLRDANFRNLTLSICVWAFANNINVLNQVYLKQVFSVTYSELALVNICASIGAVVAGFLLGKVIDRIGARPFTIVMMTVAPMFVVFWFVLTDDIMTITLPWLGQREIRQAIVIMATQSLISGGLYSSVGLGHLTLLGSLAPREGRTLAMAVHWTFIGLLGAVGPVCAGLVADFFARHPSSWKLFGSTHFHFVHVVVIAHALLIWFVAVPLLRRVRPPVERSTVSDAFANIVMVNPIRFAFGLFNMRQLDTASSPRRRVRSVSRLALARSRLATEELEIQLNDPSADVREAAVRSLGQVGTPAAIEVLLRKLDDPATTNLVPHILRVLRHTPDRRSVDALLRFLGESDRELVREAARALGATGDPRAVVPLIGLLRRTTDDTVAEASSEALSRLGDIAAIFEILPRLRRTSNPVLRRSLAVAVGNLLGRRDEFYRLLAAEERDEGTAFEELFRSLRGRARRLTAGIDSSRLDQVNEKVQRLKGLIESSNYETAANEALNLAKEMAALAGERESQAGDETYIDVMIWQDLRYAVGYWFLNLLASEGEREPEAVEVPDRLQILLAVYVLDGWARRLGEARAVTFRTSG